MSALATTGSILGMVLGTAGFTISVLNYLRDRPQVKVTLQWNMVDPERAKRGALCALPIPGGGQSSSALRHSKRLTA